MPTRITNLRPTGDPADAGSPRKAAKPAKRACNARDYALELAATARYGTPPRSAYSGKDGAIWVQLHEQYGHDELMVIIHETVRHKDKLQFGHWKDARLSAASVAYYAKTFYVPKAERAQQKAEIELPAWLVDEREDDLVVSRFAKMSGVSPEDLRRRLEQAAALQQVRGSEGTL
jgi:hypothetical protein